VGLPPDHSDEWGLDGAARQVLGLLLAGEGPGERLYAAADYLLTFWLEGYGPWVHADARQLNGAALALCGYHCAGQHPEAELWRVAGCARLASEVHARRAALEDRVAADCLLAVCRVAEELEEPISADLITLRERVWGTLMDHGRAERLHVSEADCPSHMKQPVPADQVGYLMARRPWQWEACMPLDYDPVYMAGVDLEEADGTCQNLLTLHAHMRVRHQFGSEVDWHLRLFEDVESTVSLNWQGAIRNLAGAYVETGNEEYARHAARLLWSFYRQCPQPNHHLLDGPWRTLEVGGRQAHVWPDVIGHLGRTEPFDAVLHAMLARSRLEHMRHLLAYCGYASNWYQVESAGLAAAALFSPELTHAEAYLRIALRRLRWINDLAYFDDGFQFELTHFYHLLPTLYLGGVAKVAQARGVELPQDYLEVTAKAHEMYLYAAQPDHALLTFNDGNPEWVDPAPMLRAASEVFGREDFLWGGTHGAEGREPDHTSHAWPSAGYYAMRDQWGDKGQYLCFDAGPYGAGHQHEDKLSFTLYAQGRLVLGDPNIYSYARTELTHYFRSSRGHNVVMVDGMGQARRHHPEARLATAGRAEWVSEEGFDFASGEYEEGYAPDLYETPSEPEEVDGSFRHRRAIFYVKAEYWVLCDLIRGEDEEEHRLEQLFHLAPVWDLEGPEPMRTGELSASASRIVTQEEGVGNVAILPVDPADLAVRAQKGETSPAVGWYGVMGEFPAWDVTVERTSRLPARLDAVLWPLAPGSDWCPTVRRLGSDGQATAFGISGEGIDDLFILCEEGSDPVEVEDVVFQGRALLLRRQPELRVLAVRPVAVSVGGVRIERFGGRPET